MDLARRHDGQRLLGHLGPAQYAPERLRVEPVGQLQPQPRRLDGRALGDAEPHRLHGRDDARPHGVGVALDILAHVGRVQAQQQFAKLVRHQPLEALPMPDDARRDLDGEALGAWQSAAAQPRSLDQLGDVASRERDRARPHEDLGQLVSADGLVRLHLGQPVGPLRNALGVPHDPLMVREPHQATPIRWFSAPLPRSSKNRHRAC